LENLAAAEPVRDDLTPMPDQLDAILAILEASGPVKVRHAGPAYRFPDHLDVSPEIVRITRDNAHLLRAMPAYRNDVERGLDAYEPRLAVVRDGVAVAICNSARLTGRAAEAGVETLAGYRGRGYAPLVVAAWAQAIRATGRIPLYSTSWDNLASRAVARKLGLAMYGADWSLE